MAELSDETSACCAPEQQAGCCEPNEKAECCGHGERCGCAAGAPAATLESAGLVDIEIRETHRVHDQAASAIITARKPGPREQQRRPIAWNSV